MLVWMVISQGWLGFRLGKDVPPFPKRLHSLFSVRTLMVLCIAGFLVSQTFFILLIPLRALKAASACAMMVSFLMSLTPEDFAFG